MKLPRSLLMLSIKIMLMTIILGVLYRHSQLQFKLLASFVEHPVSAVIVMCLCYLMVLFHAWRWFRLNSAQNIRLSFAGTILPTYIAVAFNTILPGSIGGDFFRLYFVGKKFPTQKTNAVLSVFVDRVTGLLGILVMACIVAPFYIDTFRHNTALFYLLIISVSICVISIISFFVFAIIISEKVGFARWIERNVRFKHFSSLVQSVLKAANMYHDAKLVILESLVMSMATQLLLLLVVWIIGNVMNLPPLPPGIYMLALVMGQIANLVPLTPGGLGVGEAAFANIIYILHPGAEAYATVFFALRILSAISYVPGVLIGLFTVILPRKKHVSVEVLDVS